MCRFELRSINKICLDKKRRYKHLNILINYNWLNWFWSVEGSFYSLWRVLDFLLTFKIPSIWDQICFQFVKNKFFDIFVLIYLEYFFMEGHKLIPKDSNSKCTEFLIKQNLKHDSICTWLHMFSIPYILFEEH